MNTLELLEKVLETVEYALKNELNLSSISKLRLEYILMELQREALGS